MAFIIHNVTCKGCKKWFEHITRRPTTKKKYCDKCIADRHRKYKQKCKRKKR